MTIRSEYQRPDGRISSIAVTVEGLDLPPQEVVEQQVRLAAFALDAAIRAAHQQTARHANGEQHHYDPATTAVIGNVR